MCGKVGVGTTSPGALLHLSQAASTDTWLDITGNSSAQNSIRIQPQNTNATGGARGLQVVPVMKAQAGGTAGYGVQIDTQPQVNLTGFSYGTLAIAQLSNSTSNVPNYFPMFFRFDTQASYTGAITNVDVFRIQSPLLNGSKPSNIAGLNILNQGAASITNAYGLRISEQSGATNNWNVYSEGTSSRNFFEGSMGIGETTPAAKLVVRSTTGTNIIEAYNDGGGAATGIVFRVERATGDVFADGSFNGGGADVAEYVNTSETVEPGDVIEIDPDKPGQFRKAREAMSPRVAGIITTEPGVVLGGNSIRGKNDADHPAVALAGRVPVKVMAKFGAIEIGDLLVSSPFPGYAMKCLDRNQCIGAIIGKAMQPLQEGVGKIMVQVMLR